MREIQIMIDKLLLEDISTFIDVETIGRDGVDYEEEVLYINKNYEYEGEMVNGQISIISGVEEMSINYSLNAGFNIKEILNIVRIQATYFGETIKITNKGKLEFLVNP